MPRVVNCVKLGKELPGLEYAPMKGELGQRIYKEVSAEAWGAWLRHSVIVINEYRLVPADPEAQRILREQMELFLFGDGGSMPQEFVPPEA